MGNVPDRLLVAEMSDRPESADQYEFSVEDGDVILLATDGLFDNVQHCKDEIKLQQSANAIALMARKLSKDPKFLSPFAVNALATGLDNKAESSVSPVVHTTSSKKGKDLFKRMAEKRQEGHLLGRDVVFNFLVTGVQHYNI